jgi:hypothetical protein
VPIQAVSANAAAGRTQKVTKEELLAQMGRKSDAHVAKLSTDKDGIITETEFMVFLDRFNKTNGASQAKLEKLETSAGKKPDLRKLMLQARKSMTESQRLDFAVMLAIGNLANTQSAKDDVQVKLLQDAVRAEHKRLLEAVMTKPGDFNGAMTAVMAAAVLPNEAFNFATSQR